MSTPEPRKHHYIPRFILKNFLDENNQVSYWNIKKKSLEKRNIMSIFMNKDMYRDEDQHKENPTIIEKQFSYLEAEIAKLLTAKLLNPDSITLTRKELETLRIFLTLLSFRSDLRMTQYETANFNESTKQQLLKYQPDGDFISLWKRELEELSRCRTYDDINQATNVDPIIKQDFQNELHSYYLTFIDSRGGEFIMTDVYPTLEIMPAPIPGANLHMHLLFPLSPTRMMILNHIAFKKEHQYNPYVAPMLKLSRIQGNMIISPKPKYKYGHNVFDKEDEFNYKVNKIYEEDVRYINSLFLNEARIGIMFKNKNRIINSIIEYNSLDGVKQSFTQLENVLNTK